jgi:hypothetical protein
MAPLWLIRQHLFSLRPNHRFSIGCFLKIVFPEWFFALLAILVITIMVHPKFRDCVDVSGKVCECRLISILFLFVLLQIIADQLRLPLDWLRLLVMLFGISDIICFLIRNLSLHVYGSINLLPPKKKSFGCYNLFVPIQIVTSSM